MSVETKRQGTKVKILSNPLAPIARLPRDLQLLFWSLFLWSFGYGLYNYIWPLFLRDLNANPGEVGLVFSIGFLSLAASMIPGGILANKYELRIILVIGWALSIPVPLMYYYARNWADVIPGIVLLQASGFNIPAFNAYIAGAAGKGKTGSSFGAVWASAPLGAVFSPAIGGVLLNWISIQQIFLFTFVLFTVSTVILFWMKPQPPTRTDTRQFRIEIPRSIPEVTLLLVLTGAAVTFSMVSPFLPLFFSDVLSLAPNMIQALGSIQALGQTAFAILLGRRADKRGRGESMSLGLVIAATGLAGIVLTRNLLFAMPLIFFVGSTRASSYIAYSILATIRSGATRGGQYGFYLTLEDLGFVAGSYLGGILYAIDPALGFTVIVVSLLLLAIPAAMTSFVDRGASKQESQAMLDLRDVPTMAMPELSE
jgi:MFS family permease